MLSDPAPKAKKRGEKPPAPLNNGMYKPFIVATTMSSAQEKGGGGLLCQERRPRFHDDSFGVKDGGWWLGCGVWANREAARRANTAFRVNMVQINGVAESTLQKKKTKEQNTERHIRQKWMS